jgi:thymidine phosphorylase
MHCETRRRPCRTFPDRSVDHVQETGRGLDVLVLDVKTGSGAFIQKYADSLKLANALCETGKTFSVNTHALITDMSQPLGNTSVMAFEVYECLKILRGEATTRCCRRWNYQ